MEARPVYGRLTTHARSHFLLCVCVSVILQPVHVLSVVRTKVRPLRLNDDIEQWRELEICLMPFNGDDEEEGPYWQCHRRFGG